MNLYELIATAGVQDLSIQDATSVSEDYVPTVAYTLV